MFFVNLFYIVGLAILYYKIYMPANPLFLQDKINVFWADYRKLLLANGVIKPADRWYVIRVENYIDAHKGTKLIQHTEVDLNQWFLELGRNEQLEGWQFKQAVSALKLLFDDLLGLDWAKNYHWDKVAVAYEKQLINKTSSPVTTVPVVEYLEYLVLRKNVAASTQKQCLNAIAFYFRYVLEKDLGDISDFTKSKRPKRLPTVLTKQETLLIINELNGVYQIMAKLLYGAGLRLMGCMRLRVISPLDQLI